MNRYYVYSNAQILHMVAEHFNITTSEALDGIVDRKNRVVKTRSATYELPSDWDLS